MSDHDTHALLKAVAEELSDIRAGVQQAGDLMGEILSKLTPQERLAYLARTQTFDVLVQRLEALSGLSASLADNQPIDTALAALPLAEMAERLQEAAHRGNTAPRPQSEQAAGEFHLFD